jgi:hypothetical protein
MKKAITIAALFIFVCSFATKAQTFFATPADSIVSTNNVNDWLSDYIHIHNNSGSSLSLSFQTIENTMDPLGWSVLLCTNAGCYPYVPSSGSLGTIANGDSAYFDLTTGFVGIAGTREIKFRVYQTGNSSNADTITYRYTANTTTGIAQISLSKIFLSQNFPNPFTTTSTISYYLPTTKGLFQIVDVTGKLISSEILSSSKGTITIGEGLSTGIFFATLKDENGKALAIRKIIVQ